MFAWLGRLASVIRHADMPIADAFKLPERRGCDDFGCGHYLAPRGLSLHKGEDFKYKPGQPVRAFAAGVVTYHGIVYEDTDEFTYIQVSANSIDRQYMYVVPALPVGSEVKKGQVIGHAQNIAGYHSTERRKMINHVHYQVKVNGQIQNPNEYL